MAVITISRMPGSLGDQLARALAEQLAYRLVGRSELVRLAGECGGPSVWERSPELLERPPSFWQRTVEDQERSARILRSIVLQLAERDGVVISGLGAGQLLRGLPTVITALVVAPDELRAQRLMQEGFEETPGPLSRQRAHDLMRRRDHDNDGYMRYLFGIDWLNPRHWDLVLNTAHVGVSEAVSMVAAPVAAGRWQPSAAEQQRLSDLALAARAEAAIVSRDELWVDRLRVSAERGRLRLEGGVATQRERTLAEQVARAVAGAEQVANELFIEGPPLGAAP